MFDEFCHRKCRIRNIGTSFNDQFLENVHLKLQDMLDSYQKPELDADIQKKLAEYLVNAGIDQTIITAINEGHKGGHYDLW